ncbi:hypothetical protein F4859DRAFT_529914 [Xylaria cf. heliscus]|nr:hypothetical protein F4859DRAFT_529914 [Xylaria cf. heliscus]
MVLETTPTPTPTEAGFGGYTKLAEYMGQQPQLAIFRRFGTLANANLLYLQAEIAELELRLKDVQKQDRESSNEDQKIITDPGTGCPSRPITKQAARNENNQELYFNKETLALRTPHPKILGDLREWITRPTMGYIKILSGDFRTWESCDESDLITFENSMMDRFTSLVTYTIIDIYHSLVGRHIHKVREEKATQGPILPLNYRDHRHAVTYTHRSIARFTQAFTVLIACTFPITAIVILYNVRDMVTRLGIIAALTGLFSTSMSILTMASLQEIFAATSAFAAVLVFFLGSTNTGP